MEKPISSHAQKSGPQEQNSALCPLPVDALPLTSLSHSQSLKAECL